MKNRKGFTLIELLAVIVILAVIALIVTPIVTGIITSAKESANARSVEGHISNVNYAIISATLGSSSGLDMIAYDSSATSGYDTTVLKTAGTNPTRPALEWSSSDETKCDNYTISNGVVQTATACKVKGSTVNYDYTIGGGAVKSATQG